MSLCPETGNEKPLFVVLAHALNAAWVTSLKREKQQIENVQRRATKMVPELRNLEY